MATEPTTIVDRLLPMSFRAVLPTAVGEFRAASYQSPGRETEHLALFIGQVTGGHDLLTRLHSACVTGEVLQSSRCDCRAQLDLAMGLIAAIGVGVLIYNPAHEGRGIGLIDKLRAYRLQDAGLDTVEANQALAHPTDARSYGVEAAILHDLGVMSVRLLTNNPEKVAALERHGIPVTERVPLVPPVTDDNRRYLQTKAARLGHHIDGLS